MRLTGPILFCAAVSTLSAEPADQNKTTAPPSKMSARLAAEIRATLPKYQPPPEQPGNETPPAPTDPEVLILPKLTVKQAAPPRIVDYDLLKKKDLNRRLIHEYENSLEGLDAVLNGFSLPVFAPSMKARARAAYKQLKLSDLNSFIESTGDISKLGGDLKKASDDMVQADNWQHSLVK